MLKQLINLTTYRPMTRILRMSESVLKKQQPMASSNLIWQPLMTVLKEDEKKLIRKICSHHLSDHQIERTSMQLIRALDYGVYRHQNPLFIALLLAGTNQSKSFVHFRERSLKLFFHHTTTKDDSVLPNAPPHIWELLVKQISEIFYEFFMKTESRQKPKLKNQFYYFMMSKEKWISSTQVIFKILSIIQKIVYESSNSIVDKIKFSNLTQKLVSKIQAKIIENPGLVRHTEIKTDWTKISCRLMMNIFKILDSFIMPEHLRNFFVATIISDDYFSPRITFQGHIRLYMSAHRYCPQYNAEGKNLILQKLAEKCSKNWQFKKQLYAYDPFFTQFTFFSILNQRLSHQYFNTPSFLVEGLVLIKQVQKPQLSSFEIEYFKNNQRNIMLGKTILLKIMPALYPELLSKKIEQKNVAEQKYLGCIDNEMITRMTLALKLLGLKFEREARVKMNKKVDFLLVDLNVVLECDGDYHINYEKFDASAKTAQRNMLLLLSGYKMISISIAEFNEDRIIVSLAKLIQKKLKLMKEHNAIYVA